MYLYFLNVPHISREIYVTFDSEIKSDISFEFSLITKTLVTEFSRFPGINLNILQPCYKAELEI